MPSRFAWLVVMVLVAGVTAPALAQEGDAEAGDAAGAREKFMKGQQAYQQGDYDVAIEAWKSAYDIDPRPLILYNLSQAYERYGMLPEAADALEKYLAEANAQDPNRDVARARLSALKERLGKTGILIKDAPEGAEIFVDGESRGRAPRTEPIPVSPGNHTVVLKLEGYQDFRGSVGVPAGQRIEVSAEMQAAVPMAEAGVEERKAGAGPYILAGVGAALVIGAGITGGLALGKAKDAESSDGDDADSAESMALVADIMGGVGGAAIAGGVIWWFVSGGFGDGGDAEEEEEAVSFAPTFGPGGAGASATVRF